jgi:hypothetical protein
LPVVPPHSRTTPPPFAVELVAPMPLASVNSGRRRLKSPSMHMLAGTL